MEEPVLLIREEIEYTRTAVNHSEDIFCSVASKAKFYLLKALEYG